MKGARPLRQPSATKPDLSGDTEVEQRFSTSLISATASGSYGNSNCRCRGLSAVTAEGPGKTGVARVMSATAAGEG